MEPVYIADDTVYLKGADAADPDGVGIAVEITAGNGGATSGDGGNIRVNAGTATNGYGGNIIITPGSTQGGGDNGFLFINLPTVDPHVNGASWWDAGVLRRSAG